MPVVYKPRFTPRCHIQPTEICTSPTSSTSTDSRLDYKEMQEIEDMNKQLLAQLEISDSESESDEPTQHPPTSTQDIYFLEDHLEDSLFLDEL